MQDLKNIRQLLFGGQLYAADTMWKMLKGERTMAPIVDDAITIYMDKQIKTAMELKKASTGLMAKHNVELQLVEA